MSPASTAKSEPRPHDVAKLLVGAIDLHCHSGPAAMPQCLPVPLLRFDA